MPKFIKAFISGIIVGAITFLITRSMFVPYFSYKLCWLTASAACVLQTLFGWLAIRKQPKV